MAWLADSEKNFEDMFIRFDRMHERDGHTDRQTIRQTPHDDMGYRQKATGQKATGQKATRQKATETKGHGTKGHRT